MAGALANQVAVVTGGTRGLGQAVATALAGAGAAVWVTSRRAASPDPSYRAAPGEVRAVQLDVDVEASVKRLFAGVQAAYGRLDLLVNNAGTGVFKPVAETTLAEWEQVLRTNLTGVFLCCREAFGLMQGQGGGRIINIASVAGYTPIAENGAYGASKYGVRGLSAILAEEGLAHNIRVALVSPGAVDTGFWAGRSGFAPADMLRPEDVAQTVLDIACRPLHVRIDEVRILPPKGVL